MAITPAKLLFDVKAYGLYKNKPEAPCAALKDTYAFSKKLMDEVSNSNPEEMFSDVFKKHQEYEIFHKGEGPDPLFDSKGKKFIGLYTKILDLPKQQPNKAKIFLKKCYDGFIEYMDKNGKFFAAQDLDLHLPKSDIAKLFKDCQRSITNVTDINKKAEIVNQNLFKLGNLLETKGGKVTKEQSDFLSDRRHEILNALGELRAVTTDIIENTSKTPISNLKYNRLFKKTEDRILKTTDRYEFFLDKGLDKNVMKADEVFGLAMEYAQGHAKSNNVKISVIGEETLNSFENGVHYRDACGQKRVKDYDLYTILSNLIQNAVKYTEKNSNVVVKLAKKNMHGYDALQVSVKDRGIGIKTEDVEKILNGQRAQNAVESGIQGTGYGLQRVNKLLQFMNSKLEIISPLNPKGKKYPGTEIKFSIPCFED